MSWRIGGVLLALLFALLPTAFAATECTGATGGAICNAAAGGAYSSMTCEEAVRAGLLRANITDGTVTVTNGANDPYDVMVTIYQMYAATIEDETIFSTAQGRVGAKSDLTLSADVPACAYQVDFVCGDTILHPPYYGERMIASTFNNQDDYCTQQPTTNQSSGVTVRVAPFYPKGNNYVFLCEPQGFTPTDYNWYFGDDQILFHQDRNDVFHTYAAPGTYAVACRATDGVTTAVGVLNVTVGNATAAVCGNGIVDAGEQCDPAAPAQEGFACTQQCALAQVCAQNATRIISDPTTMIVETGQQAVVAWEPPQDIDPSLWDQQISHDFGAGGADWIWQSYRSAQPANGSIITLRRLFNISGTPLGGTLHITAADAYEVYLNGALLGSGQTAGDWKNSNLTEQFVKTEGWQSVETFNLSGKLTSGENSIVIVAANERMDASDGQPTGTADTNPAGVIFELLLTDALVCDGNQTNGTPPGNQTGNGTLPPGNQTGNQSGNGTLPPTNVTNGTNQTGNQTGNQTNGTTNLTGCFTSLGQMPATCAGGSLLSDAMGADGCRHITCAGANKSIGAKACAKPTSASPQYFELYRENFTGGGLNVCLGGTCVGDSGFARSPGFPICPGNQTGNGTLPPTNGTNVTPPGNQTGNGTLPPGNQTGNHTGNQTGNGTQQPGNQTGGNESCVVRQIRFDEVSDPANVSGHIGVRGTLVTNGSDVSGGTVLVNSVPVGVLLNQFMVALAAPTATGTYEITARYNDDCGVITASTLITVIRPGEDGGSGGGGGGGGGSGGPSFSSADLDFGGRYCAPGYHREGERCVRDEIEEPEPIEETEAEPAPQERTDDEPDVTDEPDVDIGPVTPGNRTPSRDLLTGAVTGNPLATWWPLIVLALILIGLGIWYVASRGTEAAPAKRTRRRR